MLDSLHPIEKKYWQRFEAALIEHGHQRFLEEWPETVICALPKVLSGSDFFANQLIQHPLYLTELLEKDELWNKQSKLYYARKVVVFDWLAMESEAFDRALRAFRNKAYIRIIWRDSLHLSTVQETMQDLSDLASILIKLCVRIHTKKLVQVHGKPTNHAGIPQDLVVIAMGKLGAHELNLSSDVDLIFTYPEEGETALEPGMSAKKQLSNQEFFIRLGHRIIYSLNEVTSDGFVFRVDMRLRPYGQSGALASSFASLEKYYLDQGRSWERYAFIKARAITGEYKQVGNVFKFLNTFVYRRYVDYGVIDAIRKMKALINREVLRQGDVDNIKIGTGGIREIEFIVQIFQLIQGGQKSQLRTSRLLSALSVLESEQMLPEQVVFELREAYIFLRRSEHVLQAFDDRQTHLLPGDEEHRERMAYVMGFSAWHLYAQVLEKHRNLVRLHFGEMVKPDQEEEVSEDLQVELFQAWWLDELTSDQLFLLLQDTEFADIKTANLVLNDFRISVYARLMQRTEKERIDQLMPILLSCIAENELANTVLSRITMILEQVIRRSSYISLLIERPKALSQLIMLCGVSQWIPEELTRFPHLLDELLYDFHLMTIPTAKELREELRQQLLRVPEEDLESQMEILRMFKNVHRFHAAVAEIMQVFPVTEISDYLTLVAECLLQMALDISVQQLVAKYGLPQRSEAASSPDPIQILIIAYGKMGSMEMSYGSDLDLVFVYQAEPHLSTQGPKSIENQVFYARLVQRTIHILSTTTHGGRLYEVDTRLRPSGESGLLVCQLQYLEQYLLNNAWTWEHQALVRARAVAGHPDLSKDFDQLRQNILCLPRTEKILQIQIIKMRAKMMEQFGMPVDAAVFDIKQDAGGLVDIEFIAQYGVLLWAQRYPDLVQEVGTLKIIEAFSRLDLLSTVQAEQLSEAYIEYRSMIHLLIIKNLPSTITATKFEYHRTVVRSVWREFICCSASLKLGR